MAKDMLTTAAVGAAFTAFPKALLPTLALTAGALLLEDDSPRKEASARNARLFDACKSAWNDPTQEINSRSIFAREIGKPAFDRILCSATLASGFKFGARMAESKFSRLPEKKLTRSMVMSEDGTFNPVLMRAYIRQRMMELL